VAIIAFCFGYWRGSRKSRPTAEEIMSVILNTYTSNRCRSPRRDIAGSVWPPLYCAVLCLERTFERARLRQIERCPTTRGRTKRVYKCNLPLMIKRSSRREAWMSCCWCSTHLNAQLRLPRALVALTVHWGLVKLLTASRHQGVEYFENGWLPCNTIGRARK
jgi:hypothetical protein